MSDSGSSQNEPSSQTAKSVWLWSCAGCLSAFLAMMFCAFVGLYLGPVGASLAGLKPVSSGNFDLSPLPYLFFGFVAGGGVFLISMAVFRRIEPMERIGMAVLFAMFGSFLSGLVGHPAIKFSEARKGERNRQRAMEEAARYNEYHRELKENPGVVLAEKWYRRSSDPESYIRWRVYRDSLENPYVPYTPDILSVLLAAEEDPFVARKILQDPRLDLRRLEAEFRSRLEALTGRRAHNRRVRGYQEQDGRNLIDILAVPRAKDEWFEEVAASGVTGGEPAEWKLRLRKMIDDRQSHESPQPPGSR